MFKPKKQSKVNPSVERELRLWQTTFDAINDSVFIIDIEHKILQCNKATLAFFKKSSIQEVVGHSCCELVHGKTEPVEWCPTVCMMESCQRESSTAQMGDKWVEVFVDPILDDNNQIIGAVHLITDITHSKLTEIKLREAEEKYHGLFDKFPHFIGLFDLQGILIECNIAINKILSRHIRDDLIGLNIAQILSIVDKNKELIPKFKELINQTISDGILEPFEFKLYRSKGGFLWLSIEGSTILIGGRKFIEFLIQDITERKITQDKLIKSEFKHQQRVKELSCIYKLSKLIDNPDLTREGLFYGTIELIPPALRFSEKSRVRITYRKKTYTSIDFKESKWKLTATETISGKDFNLEVCYLENLPFLKEEYDLIGEIIIRLKSSFEEREAQKKLKESEEKYRNLVNSIPDLLLEVDLKGKFTYASPQLYDIFGFTPSEILNKSMRKFIHPDDILGVLEALKEAYQTKEDITIEYRTLHKDGHYVYASAKGSLLDTGRFYGVVRDISERKIAELKLRQSEEKYRLISETAYDLIAVLDRNYIYEYTNENALQQILGYSKEEVLGTSALKLVHPDDLNSAIKDLSEGFKSGHGEAELRVKHKDGYFVWLEVTGKTFVDFDDELKALLISRDFTKRKIAEEKLRKSEERYRLISQNADENLFIFDMSLNLIYNDTDVPNILGYTYEEMRKLKLTDYNVASSLKIALKAYREELRSERKKIGDPKRIRTFEVEQIHKNGSIVNVETRFTFLRDKSGIATGIVGLSRNISKRKQAEQKLTESEEKFRLIAEQTLVGISIIQNGELKYINRAFGEIHEYTVEEMYERTMDDLINNIHPDDVHLVREKKILRETGDKRIHHLLFRVKTKSGKLKWLDNASRVIQYDGGDALLSTIIDITEIKEIEKKLNDSKSELDERVRELTCLYELSKLVEDSTILLGDILNGTLNLIPPAFQFPDITTARITYDGRDYKLGNFEETEWKLSTIVKIGEKQLMIEVYYLKDTPFIKEEQDLIKEIGIRLKVTIEEKEIQNRLRESEERYRLISQNADENLFIFDMNLNVIYNDPNVPNILGYTNDEIGELKLTDYNEPSSLKILLKAYQEELRNERKKIGDPKRIRMFEIDQIHKDGSIVNVEVKFTFLRDEKGIAKGIISITRDISKRKQAEQKLRESEEKYRLISETAYDLIGMLNKRFKYEYINESAFQQILGYSSSEILGKSALKFVHPDDVSSIAKTLFEGFKEGQGEGVLRFKHKEGHWIWIEAKGKTFFDRDGELKAIVISRDITERKKAEEQLKESETKYREAYNRATFYKDLFGHDMNNILTVINSSVDLIPYYLGESEKSKNIRSITNIVQNQVNRGAKLISNVNALSELEESAIPIEPVDVNMFLENSIEFIKTSFKERDLKFNIDYSNGSKFKAQANQLLREVFDNILINAIKYNDNSMVEISIKVSDDILDVRSFVKVEFNDNGIGVPDERKKMIFKRGNRELKGSKGMGIGLSLVKKILKNYKGKIWVEDRVKGDYSKGSKFIILIPKVMNG